MSTIEKFMEGWFTDDLDMVLGACADDFVYDDAMDGRFTKAEFADYWRGLPDGDGDHSDAVVQEVDGEETGWIAWAWKPEGAADWTQEGTALTKAGPDGVHSMRVAYYYKR